jgi:phytoene synthase
VYLPAADARRFGADPWRREVDDAWRGFMAFEIGRNRELYDLARTGVAMLPPASARCVGTALALYSRILERIEARDYDVFSGRARVPTWRKAMTAAGFLAGVSRAVA